MRIRSLLTTRAIDLKFDMKITSGVIKYTLAGSGWILILEINISCMWRDDWRVISSTLNAARRLSTIFIGFFFCQGHL